jgi:hypothetical protein
MTQSKASGGKELDVVIKEQRDKKAESREQRAKKKEQRTEERELRAESEAQRR